MNIFKKINKWRSDREAQKQSPIIFANGSRIKFKPGPELKGNDIAFIVNHIKQPSDNLIAGFMKAVAQLYADEAEELNSGVMIKDGTVWHNMN